MSEDNQYVLNWHNYSLHLKQAFNSLLKANESVDVTLTCEGKKISAHKMLLSAGSTFFHDLFRDNPCEHTIVILSDVNFQDLEYLLTFMYTGEVRVPTENFDSFLKTAELLHVSGLPGIRRRPINVENEHGKAHDEAELSQHMRSLLKRHVQTDNSNTLEKKPRKRLKLKVDPTTTTIIKQEQVEVLKTEPEEVPLDDNFNTLEENPSKRLKLEVDPTAITKIKQEHVEVLKTKPEELPLDDSLRIDTADAKPQAITPFSLLSRRQKKKNRRMYQDFFSWRIRNKFRGVNEKILLQYFNELGTTYRETKLPNKYAMLKLTLNEFEHVDITRFPLLLKYHKERRNRRTLESKHVKKFLLEAPDYQYLHAKIVLILAVAGKCRCVDLRNLELQGVKDEGSFLSITLPSTKTFEERKFVVTNKEFGVNVLDIFKKYLSLRPNDINHNKFLLPYKDSRCLFYPLTATDLNKVPKQIATYLDLYKLDLRFQIFFGSAAKII